MSREIYRWVEPDGTTTVLPVYDPKRGRGMPPIDVREEIVPRQAGSRLREVRHATAEVDLTFGLVGPADEVRTATRAWHRRLDPTRGEGAIEVTTRLGDTRRLPCRYVSGLELEEADPTWQVAVLTFRAFDPYWLDPDDVVDSYPYGPSATFFPLLPLTLLATTPVASPVIDNTGDVATWPIFEIYGPSDGLIVLRHLDRVERLELTRTLAIGERLTIDTRPGVKTVTDEEGRNLYPLLSADSTLFPLDVGDNRLSLEVEGATVDTRLDVRYARRWLAP